LKPTEIAASIPNGDDLGVRGRVVGRSYLVTALTDDVAVFHDHTAERSAEVSVDALLSKLDRTPHKFPVLVGHLASFGFTLIS
jgi:hypothetical protein